MHFLYAKYHADISPIGGHDGFDEPSCNGDFHWLHHSKFECNYGVPFPVNFDKIFGTWQDYKEYKQNGGKMSAQMQKKVDGVRNTKNGTPETFSCCAMESSDWTSAR